MTAKRRTKARSCASFWWRKEATLPFPMWVAESTSGRINSVIAIADYGVAKVRQSMQTASVLMHHLLRFRPSNLIHDPALRGSCGSASSRREEPGLRVADVTPLDVLV